MVNYPQSKYSYRGIDSTLTWIADNNIQKFTRVTQALGIVFDEYNQILISKKPNGLWQLPGGTPEKDETPIEALIRELLEEADVTVKNIIPLGAQKVEMKNNPKKYEGDLF